MSNKIKIVGYAKKEFFTDGIEYRNFSPDLVGNQLATNEGTPVFTMGNFSISTNLDDKVTKTFTTNSFSNYMSLDNLNIDEAFETVVAKYAKKAKLNLDYDDVLTYAFFGSLQDFIRVSLENIIIKWPASLYVSEIDPTNAANTGDTITNYVFNATTNTSTFDVNVNRIENPYNLNFLSGGTIEGTFNETNQLRNLAINYNYYEVNNGYGNFSVIGFIGSSNLTTSKITLQTEGNPFPNSGTENINYHIRPNELKREEFFFNLNEFENKLLNRLTIPTYTSRFKVSYESENGTTVESTKKITWPIRDGYNIDFNSIDYSRFVKKLLEISDVTDGSRSNLMVRFLVSSSISEFDSAADINGSYQNTNGQKMTSALKIYGREFDEIKKYSDGIKFANVVTYDKKNNTPDAVIKNLARVLGWQLTTSISEIDIIGNFLSLNGNYYDGYSRGLSDAEAEVELWRRIVLNTPWLWKSKGTRKAIEFLFKFIGVPNGLITFNEYVYVADKPVDVGLVTEMMEYFNNTSDISELNLDSNGYPFVKPNTPEMYFQKAGLWYRQTGGANPDIDIIEGNNPHMGPYDGGQEYINQFNTCLVPNFVGGLGEEIKIEAQVNLFSNYGNGTFDECCDGNIYVTVDTALDFNSIVQVNVDNVINNFPVTETGCTFTSTWTLIAQLTGETFYENTFFTGETSSGVTISSLTETEYLNEIYNLSGTTELSGVTFSYNNNGSLDVILPDGCNNDLLSQFFKLELCVSTEYNCIEEGVGSSGLTEFLVAIKTSDACGTTNPQSIVNTLYHDGSGLLPEIGDSVFTDSQGVIPYESPNSNAHLYMGGDINDKGNYLLTNASGVRLEIICPVEPCTVVLSKTIGQTSGTGSFSIDGLTVPNDVSIIYTLYDIVRDNSLANISVVFDNGVILNENSTPVSQTVTISPVTGLDYEVTFGTLSTNVEGSNVSQFKVRIEIIDIGNNCVIGPAFQILTITLD
jgi:hypothetical protein|tara:strand:+ start:23445 stop:26378 length:2934 start_codon:yes stop_codon:yes gene_type:complete